jgi:hypothetical protein
VIDIVAIEGESNADDLAVPSRELQHVRAPADIRADRRHLVVMLARLSSAGITGEQQAVQGSQRLGLVILPDFTATSC